eukprot:366239-Chlamydomonas_euryale.AAC.20
MSYSLRIEARDSRTGSVQDLFDDGQDSSVGPGEHLDDDGAAAIEFSAGNPRVEHIYGVVHLYRNLPLVGLAPSLRMQKRARG